MALLNEDFSKGAIACGARRRLAAFVLGPHVLLRHRSRSHATDAKNADYPKQQSKRDSDYIAHVEHRSKNAVIKKSSTHVACLILGHIRAVPPRSSKSLKQSSSVGIAIRQGLREGDQCLLIGLLRA